MIRTIDAFYIDQAPISQKPITPGESNAKVVYLTLFNENAFTMKNVGLKLLNLV